MIIPIYGIPINKQPLAKATPNGPTAGETRSKRSEGSTTWRLGVRMLRLVHGWPVSRDSHHLCCSWGKAAKPLRNGPKLVNMFFLRFLYIYIYDISILPVWQLYYLINITNYMI